jgi:hypothetical protein
MSHMNLLHPMCTTNKQDPMWHHIFTQWWSPIITTSPNAVRQTIRTHPMSHMKFLKMSNFTQCCTPYKYKMSQVNILFRLCMHECMMCVACPCRNICTKYYYTLLCWVSILMGEVVIKAHDWSRIHWESHAISREEKIEQNASIIHSLRNERKGCVIIVIINVNSWPIFTSNCKGNRLWIFLFAVEFSR